jgi:hypothetical protein
MDFHKHIEEQLSEDFKLLKEIEDRRRSEDDPRRRRKLENDIEEIKQQILRRQRELNSLSSSPIIALESELLNKKPDMQCFARDIPIANNKLMSVQNYQAIEVFYSYAHEDEKLRNDLEKHLSSLKREGVITGWHDRKIGAGKEWQNEIDTHLNSSQIILLLISANFIASDYCWDVEMKRAMERHETQEARIIPVILDSVDWMNTPFAKLQALPERGKPVKKWGNRNDAFLSIAQGIRIVAKELAENLYNHTY